MRVCVIRVGGGREEEREGKPAAHLSHCAGEEEPDQMEEARLEYLHTE